ncbi:MAG: hypothetical protein ACI97A_004269 [Planctomycetota bacterium]|jgi:hypothetical protein
MSAKAARKIISASCIRRTTTEKIGGNDGPSGCCCSNHAFQTPDAQKASELIRRPSHFTQTLARQFTTQDHVSCVQLCRVRTRPYQSWQHHILARPSFRRQLRWGRLTSGLPSLRCDGTESTTEGGAAPSAATVVLAIGPGQFVFPGQHYS